MWIRAAATAVILLAGCRAQPTEPQFPQAHRDVAPIVGVTFSTEDARDRAGEAEEVMQLAGVKPGMSVADVGAGLSRLTDATLEATLDVAGRAVREQRGLETAPTRMAIVAMGRYGGFELSYGSDADVLFVHDPQPGADPHEASTYAHTVANELRRLLLLPGGDREMGLREMLRAKHREEERIRRPIRKHLRELALLAKIP